LLAIVACSKASPPEPAPPEPAPHHEDRGEPAEATPALHLDVRIDGSQSTWRQDVFDRVPHWNSANNQGEARETWSLRELVHTAVGPTARVVAVVGDRRVAIEPAAWSDEARTPIVHRTRRGALKFRWADKNGTWGAVEVKDVSGLEIAH
jgi:hypothetical protein